jgi:hypothetical protein
LPLGGEWAIGLLLIFVCLIAYHQTKNFTAVALVGVLFSAAFIQLYPPIIWTVGIPLLVAFALAITFYLIYKVRKRRIPKGPYTFDWDGGD